MLADRRPPAGSGADEILGPRVARGPRRAIVTLRPSECLYSGFVDTDPRNHKVWLTQHREVGILTSRTLKRHALLRVRRIGRVTVCLPCSAKAVRHLRRLRRVSLRCDAP